MNGGSKRRRNKKGTCQIRNNANEIPVIPIEKANQIHFMSTIFVLMIQTGAFIVMEIAEFLQE
jgi:hypothetical protein